MDAAGGYLVAVAVGTGAYDVWLGWTGRRTITGALKDNHLAAGLFTILLTAHVAEKLGRWDPFHAAARRIGRLRP